MIPFPTTKKELIKLNIIIDKLKTDNFNYDFIANVNQIARIDQGVFDLLNIWFKEIDNSEKEATMICIKSSLNDYYDPWIHAPLTDEEKQLIALADVSEGGPF